MRKGEYLSLATNVANSRERGVGPFSSQAEQTDQVWTASSLSPSEQTTIRSEVSSSLCQLLLEAAT